MRCPNCKKADLLPARTNENYSKIDAYKCPGCSATYKLNDTHHLVPYGAPMILPMVTAEVVKATAAVSVHVDQDDVTINEPAPSPASVSASRQRPHETRGHRLSPAQRADLYRQLKAGEDIRDIAAAINVTTATVYDYRNKLKNEIREASGEQRWLCNKWDTCPYINCSAGEPHLRGNQCDQHCHSREKCIPTDFRVLPAKMRRKAGQVKAENPEQQKPPDAAAVAIHATLFKSKGEPNPRVFTVVEKLTIIEEARNGEPSKVAAKYGIKQGRIDSWRQREAYYRNISDGKEKEFAHNRSIRASVMSQIARLRRGQIPPEQARGVLVKYRDMLQNDYQVKIAEANEITEKRRVIDLAIKDLDLRQQRQQLKIGKIMKGII